MGIDFVKNYNYDINLEIFSKLNERDLAVCCRVSKPWRDFASLDELWKGIFQGVEVPEGMGAKEFFTSRAVYSVEEMITHLKEFLSKIPRNQKAQFDCLFPFNPECSITARMAWGPDVGEEWKDEVCIYMRRLSRNSKTENSFAHSNFTLAGSRTISAIDIAVPSEGEFNNRKALRERIQRILVDRIDDLKSPSACPPMLIPTIFAICTWAFWFRYLAPDFGPLLFGSWE